MPLENASVSGNDVAVSYDKDKVKDAPRVDPDGSLSPEEEDRLYEYYGLGSGTSTTGYDDSTRGTDSGIAAGYVENAAPAPQVIVKVGAEATLTADVVFVPQP